MALSSKKKIEPMASYQEPSSNSVNQIVNGTEIIGEIKSSGDVRIDGKLKGNINIKGRLVIGNTGFIDGEINCANCDVSGKILGKVVVSELFSIKASAKIEGEVITKKLAIEPGAEFNVTCKTSENTQAAQTNIQQGDKKEKGKNFR